MLSRVGAPILSIEPARVLFMTAPPVPRPAGADASARQVVLAFVLTIALFWPTLQSFPGTWARYGMTQGWLMAALVAWVLWRDRTSFRTPWAGDSSLLIPLAGLSLLWFASTVAHVQLGHQLGFVLVLALWGLAVFGWRSLRPIVLAVATFTLALPIWNAFIPILQKATTAVSGGLVAFLGIEAEIQGDFIHIASGSFFVSDGCAGLNFLLAGLVIGVVYAHTLVRGWRTQLGVVALIAVITVLGNWFRVTALIVIGHLSEMQSGLMDDHMTFGWVAFTVGLVPFFFLAGRLADREARGSRHEDIRSEGEPFNGNGTEDPLPRTSRRLVAASVVAVVGPTLYFVVGAIPPVEIRDSGLVEMVARDGWTPVASGEARPFQWRPGFEGSDEHERVAFTDGAVHVYADRFVYLEQVQGAKLVGYPNRIAPPWDVVDERLVGPIDTGDGHVPVRQVMIRDPEVPVLAWYWYRVGGRHAHSAAQAKVMEVFAFLRRRPSGELVVFSVPCDPGDCAGAARILADFTGAPRSSP